MIQLYADGVLAYDSRLREKDRDYTLLGLKTTTGLNKGGTAEIVMPPGHPAYSLLVSHRTVVEIYRDGVLRWRGRALYPADEFYNRRTWTCEGELCLFQDGTSRPYRYQDTPEAIFTAIVEDYNSQVEPFKQFKVGAVTVTDTNDYVRLESENAEQTLDTLNKLLKRCGGYIYFSTDQDDGARVINWLANLGHQSTQAIEFGENLLDFSRNGSNTDLATVIVPYGAKDEATGKRVTIESVNNGLDYIVDDEAKALRGVVSRPVTWDDVTSPANLLTKARKYLKEHRQIVTSLQLTAVDLSYLDKDIESYQVGDSIRVRSKPHRVDEDFQLTERTEDWLNPDQSSITLGKTISTLTDADVAGDKQSQSDLHKVQLDIKIDYTRDINQAVEASEVRAQSLIQQTSDSLYAEVVKQQKDIEGVKTQMTTVEHTTESVSIQVQDIIDNGVSKVKTGMGYTFDDEGLRIEKQGEEIQNLIDNRGVHVTRSGDTMLKADADGVIATDVKVRNYLMVGKHARFEDYSNGLDRKRTACFWIEGE